MSHEINPVLAGVYDAPDYAPAHNYTQATNVATSTDEVTAPDSRRYTRFDHSATEAGTATLSFNDFLDMINPLEHIPVVSSIYRAVTDEQINPVSRVVGDILYGGFMGGASAIFSGVTAVADAGLEEKTGKDSGGLLLAALFGDDKKPDTVQLADATTTAAPVNAAVPAVQKIELAQAVDADPMLAALQIQTKSPAPAAQQTEDSQTSNTAAAVAPVSTTPQAQENIGAIGPVPSAPAKSFPLKPRTDTASTASKSQDQDLAIALAQGSPGMRMGHTIYTSRLMNGSHPLPPMIAPKPATAPTAQAPDAASVVAPPPVLPPSIPPVSNAVGPAPFSTSGMMSSDISGLLAAMSGVPPKNSSSSDLAQDMMLKALSQYGHVSAAPATPGSMVNLIN